MNELTIFFFFFNYVDIIVFLFYNINHSKDLL